MIAAQSQIIIVGGGVVGLAMAVGLARENISVALIEGVEPETEWPEESVDMRVFAITRASERLFNALDVWDAIVESGVSQFHDMRVWDAAGKGNIHFDAAEVGQPWLGHIIESRVISRALFKALQSLPSASLYCPSTVAAFSQQGDAHQVTLEDGTELTGDLLIGADGKASKVRDYADIQAPGVSYDQQALVCIVETELPHQKTAWQRFLPTGPLAFLPLRDGRSSIVWSATSQEAERLIALDKAAFCMELSRAFDFRLGVVMDSSERILFPLIRQHAGSYVKPGLALVGDAAHVIHPLAGQGVNLGLSDVRELSQVIKRALLSDRNPGSLSVLRRYERARKGDNLMMMSAMTGFNNLFGSPVLPVQLIRNLGLDLVDRVTPVKHKIMREAMGFE
ncbi:MAG: UbiH/UbiF/VisC/COQ6 family ubiquinone biosynthesis hydroxylase [Gammaproteobacteria bacterium]